jgi:anti-anti-sigma factor
VEGRTLTDLATLTFDERDAVTIARLVGEIDISNADDIERELRATSRRGGGSLVVDLAGVGFLDSAWLHLATRISADLRSRGETLCLVVPPDATVRRTLVLAGMGGVAPIADTEEEAIARVTGARQGGRTP